MKRILLPIYLIFLNGLLVLVLWKSDFLSRVQQKIGGASVRQEITPHYQSMVTYQLRMDGSVLDDSVVFIGDSMVQSLFTDAVVSPSVNYGIGGDTTVGVLGRIGDYQSLKRVRAVVIAIGVNDLKFRGNAEILSNYRKILSQLRPELPVLISGILPIDERVYQKYPTVSNDRVLDLNRSLEELSDERTGWVFVDAGPDLAGPDGNLSTAVHVGDGIHLNTVGYQIWIRALKGGMEKVLPARR